MYCIVTQFDLFENAEKLPEETARLEWSGTTGSRSEEMMEKAGEWRRVSLQRKYFFAFSGRKLQFAHNDLPTHVQYNLV